MLHTINIKILFCMSAGRNFNTPVFDVLWYTVVRVSVCLAGPVREEELYCFSKIGGQRSRSYCHIEGKHCQNEHDDRKMPIVGDQRSRSYCHIVGKSDKIRCRQDND